MNRNQEQNIILFDGICNVCNSLVKFMFKVDKKGIFSFASLQSDIAARLLKEAHMEEIPDSVIVIRDGQALVKSDAAIYIFKKLGGVFQLSAIAYILPRSARDRIYDGIAKRRYKLFGKREECMLPTKEQRNRFLG
ncbi:thiol-disulfide oxidoreductase DCC family protein [Guptibacillus spartinae]|uniref:thiol-disulfide oxidoreductase DCC family protein n=1 Tax=Guptibacillus spartinae TaxID=3025679 RepID=UPI0023630F28|nr:DCC1-like thiol-disulfide oxidoreductase family protein [Pseudalkalibacillus spartinae]